MSKFQMAVAAALLVSGAAQAAPLYTSTGYAGISSPSVNAWCSSCSGNYDVLNPFTLTSASVLTGTDTAAQSNYGRNWNITVSIWDASRTSVLDTATFTAGNYAVQNLAGNVSDLTFSLPAWNLAAGSYWISYYDPTNFAVPGYRTGGADQQYDIGYGFLGTSGAYRVSGVSAVPENSSLALLAAGLAFVGFAARRRRQG